MRYVALIIVTCCATFAQGQPQEPAGQSPQTIEAVKRFHALQYGMFIHFGISTFTRTEIDTGRSPSTTYAPTDLDVDQWIRVAHEAGMTYAVLTSKHAAGHCLWDSKVQFRGKEYDYDVATSGNKTDVVAEFVKACKTYDVMPGLYWCLLDGRNNSISIKSQWRAGRLPDDFFQLAIDQLAELIENYPSVNYYWLDIPASASLGQRQAIYDHIHKLRPGTVVLFNHGTPKPDGPITIEKFHNKSWPTDVLNTERNPIRPGWFTPQQSFMGKRYELAYEHCDTICKRWFWVSNDPPRSVDTLYHIYKQATDAGGSLLLNVPPDNTGRISAYHVEALMKIKQMIDNEPSPALSKNRPASASNTYKNDPQYDAASALDGSPFTRWATDESVRASWLSVDMGQPMSFNRAIIMEAYPEQHRVQRFRIEYKSGEHWKTCYEGERIGEKLTVSFRPVTAQHVRLNITEAAGAPTIWEFQLRDQSQ